MAKKVENFKEMNKEELKAKLGEMQESLRVLRFKIEGSKSKNVKEENGIRKQIARIMTELNNKKN